MRSAAILAFSLYLIHKQIYAWLDTLLPDLGSEAPILALTVYLTTSLAAATLLYLAIERPGLRVRRAALLRAYVITSKHNDA